MARLFLVRHGESEANADEGLLDGGGTLPQHFQLTPDGVAQAEACGRHLAPLLGVAPYTVFVSPYLRTQQTWERMARSLPPAVRAITDGRIREQEFKATPTVQERLAKKQRAKVRGKLYYRYKGGESGFDVFDRAASFFNQLRFDLQLGNRTPTIVVVSHEVVIRCLLMVALDLHPSVYERMDLGNCEITELLGDSTHRFELAFASKKITSCVEEGLKSVDWRKMHPIEAGAVVVDEQRRVLLSKDVTEDGAEYWGLPKRVVAIGEGLDAAAARAVREELGLEVARGDFIGDCSDDDSCCRYFLVRAGSGPVPEGEVQWASLDGARALLRASPSAHDGRDLAALSSKGLKL